jgi:DNA primase
VCGARVVDLESIASALLRHGPGPVTLLQEPPVPRHADSTKSAIKQAVDIVALVGEDRSLVRAGSKYKALCPFHDDHNPSLEVNPDRQSYKCWSCGAGGDVFSWVQARQRVEFPEALRMLAERAGIALETSAAREPAADGPTRAELLDVHDWAQRRFVEALSASDEVRAYVAARGIVPQSVERFGLGFAPDRRDWLQAAAQRKGFGTELLEHAGLVSRNEAGELRERFRGRLILPIRSLDGKTIAFGGRILPAAEKARVEASQSVAKYLNSPETRLFQKRKTLYAADLAKAAAAREKWVAVVEGYTDVIAAHQAGLMNVVGTLGTALNDDHVTLMRRLADRAVLIFDGDEAGQSAAERAIKVFLAHEMDVRVMTLPAGTDPADFFGQRGLEAFRALLDRAIDPLNFAIDRAAARYDFTTVDGAWHAAQSVLALLAEVPPNQRGSDLRVAKALDTLGHRLGIAVPELSRRLAQLRSPRRSEPRPAHAVSESSPLRAADLDRIDRELVALALAEPAVVARLIAEVPASSLRDAPLRFILQMAYELYGDGQDPTSDNILTRIDDPQVKALAAQLIGPVDPQPMPAGVEPATAEMRLDGLLATLAERRRQERLRHIAAAIAATDPAAFPDEFRALELEQLRLLNQRPGTRKPNTAV